MGHIPIFLQVEMSSKYTWVFEFFHNLQHLSLNRIFIYTKKCHKGKSVARVKFEIQNENLELKLFSLFISVGSTCR